MGKGDQRTRKGKRFRGSYGKTRMKLSSGQAHQPTRTSAVAEEVTDEVAEAPKAKKAPKPKAATKEKKAEEIIEPQAEASAEVEKKAEKPKKAVKAAKEKTEDEAAAEPAGEE
jgi:ribosomal small subunit protein bTHX